MTKGHALTGVLVCGLAGPVIPSPMDPVTAVAVAGTAGSFLALLMDLDTKGKAYYVLRPLSWVLKPLLVGLSSLIYWATRGDKDPEDAGMHRMFTHQPEFALLCAILAFIFIPHPWAWWSAGIVYLGVWSHRLGDACTKAGVPISLTRVIVRAFKGCDRTWLRMGIPRWMRFIAGGKKGVKMFGAKNRRLWDEIGEGVMTFALVILCVVLGAATSAGYYPFWL